MISTLAHSRRLAPPPLQVRRFAAKVIDGKKLRASILERVRQEVTLLPKPPGLTVIQVGGHADSSVYVRHKLSAAHDCGMRGKHVKLPRSSTQSDILATIHEVNNDPETHGVLLQLPLDTEKDVNQSSCLNAIDPMKDVDGLHHINAGLLSHGDLHEALLPCTPRGCIELIKSTGQPIAGASAVVLGRSAIVGTPMSELLKWHDATVTIMHSKTKDMKERTREADIVVAACRQEEMVKADWLKPGAIVIDVGIHSIPDPTKKKGYRLTGDVDYKSASTVAGWITPVPGHVGPMTVAMVVQNTLDCAKRFMLGDHHHWDLRPLSLQGGMASSNWSISDPSRAEDLQIVRGDLEVSQAAKPKHIEELCKEMRLFPLEYRVAGNYMAKLSLALEDRFQDNAPQGKYVVMAAMTPTPLGEGKTTTACGLTQALGAHLGKNVIATLRQPAMGPLLSVKGGANGGGFSQVIPMETFNSHMTGDLHAIAQAQNLLAAAVDSRIGHEASALSTDKFFASLVNCAEDDFINGTFTLAQRARLKRLGIEAESPNDLDASERRRFARLDIDPQTVNISRAVDMNDEMLRSAMLLSRRSKTRFPMKRVFENTTACELMSILALCHDLDDLQARVAKMLVALDRSGNPVTVEDIGAVGAVTWIMYEAIRPTLMQTIEGTPVLVHAGPFASLGTGNCSVIADRMALKLVGADGYVVTEAGHGADVGLEKFFHLKCRTSGFWPNCVVLVASCRSLKVQGGAPAIRYGGAIPEEWTREDLELLTMGAHDLRKQIQIVTQFGVPVVVAVNAFSTDSDAELEAVRKMALEFGAADAVVCHHWEFGGRGAINLAETVMKVCDAPAPEPKFLYNSDASPQEKIEVLARKVYGFETVKLSSQAKENLASIESLGLAGLPLCVAQSPFKPRSVLQSEGDEKKPLVIRNIRVAAGAGMLIMEVDKTVTMPMLPVRPNFYDINWTNGCVEGLK